MTLHHISSTTGHCPFTCFVHHTYSYIHVVFIFECVFLGKYRQAKPWYFIFVPSYWCCCSRGSSSEKSAHYFDNLGYEETTAVKGGKDKGKYVHSIALAVKNPLTYVSGSLFPQTGSLQHRICYISHTFPH